MSKITSIEQQKINENRFSIFINDKFSFGLNASICHKHKLEVDMEIDEEFIGTILKAEESTKAINYAIYLLSKKDRTKKEIADKLKDKGYDDEIASNVLNKLSEYNYINDEIYCGKYINDKSKFSKYGINKIKAKLYAKGVDKEIISKEILKIDNNLEFENALTLAQKKLCSIKDTDKYKIKAKLSNHLVAKGYSYDTVKAVFSKLEL
jgi:regulatory protein